MVHRDVLYFLTAETFPTKKSNCYIGPCPFIKANSVRHACKFTWCYINDKKVKKSWNIWIEINIL